MEYDVWGTCAGGWGLFHTKHGRDNGRRDLQKISGHLPANQCCVILYIASHLCLKEQQQPTVYTVRTLIADIGFEVLAYGVKDTWWKSRGRRPAERQRCKINRVAAETVSWTRPFSLFWTLSERSRLFASDGQPAWRRRGLAMLLTVRYILWGAATLLRLYCAPRGP